MEEDARDINALLSRLHLQGKYQQKLKPADFLTIGPPVPQHHETSEEDLVHTFLQRLMMLDHRARYIPVKEDTTEERQSHVAKGESDVDDFLNASRDTGQRVHSYVHPMDVQMAVFHCSDSFLRQNMITKLSQCQYALPLLVPDPFTGEIECPLWTFRQVRRSWKPTDKSNVVTNKSMPVCNAETPMVSFFRLGSESLSKSQLINTLINERHNTFFHRNCPGSTQSRYLMDGVAEIAWYCPAGKPNDAFTDCIAFCNLHGDALSNEKQRDILIEKASVNVVLLQTPKKGDKTHAIITALYNSPKPLICLLVDDDTPAIMVKEGKYKIGVKGRSQSDVSDEIKGIIRKSLSGPHTSFRLDTMADVSGIRVDEKDKVCEKGKSAAVQMLNLLKGMDISKIKDTFLPCQGKLWKKWCGVKKELYCLKGNIEEERCKKEEDLKEIRREQCDASSSQLMQLFIKNLQSLLPNEKTYFLKWIGILLDDLSTDDLSEILREYDEKWAEVVALKKKHEKSENDKSELKKKQDELEKISAKLQSATVGFEHILREMGQIYEAHASLESEKGKNNCSNYPELAAELMISGQPMELMDGDAAHVPITWVTNVLDEVIKKLGDKRVFVVSVLGIQSSGKSTMLNAMFGLQFAVSAGRCTKGAFMQLVEVSEVLQKDLKFDYVLVVDTEGLRALELAGNTTLHHDNELATFVIGLGNMTLINIFGENPAEMQDILQISVQAFMRMTKVNFSPKCVFVHQNVTDIAAGEKNMEGKRRLQDKLDKMTQLAAKEEVFDAECFSDVIAFDVQEDVKYFAQLWEGSPPMAPPNPGYSESIQDLKNIILSKASKSADDAAMTLSRFKHSIQDLWNALLNEHFVFSFKNTLEIAVYRKLEVQYGKWTWDLRKAMLTIEDKRHNRIKNGVLDMVERSSLVQEMSNTREQVEKTMKEYFDDDTDKDLMVQWRGRFESKIKEVHDEQVEGTQRKLQELIRQKKACKQLDDKKTEFENNLLQKSKELARKLKDKAKDEKNLQKEFNNVWKMWVTELTAGMPAMNDINTQDDEYAIFQDLGIEWALINDRKRCGRYKEISNSGNYTDYIQRKKWLNKLMNRDLSHEEQQPIRSLIAKVEKESRDIIKSKSVAEKGYNIGYLHEVAKNVNEKVKEFESKRDAYGFRNEFTVDLLLYVFDIVRSLLLKSHNEFKENNDARTYLESNKEQYYGVFESYCKGNSSAAVLGELMCRKLKDSTVQAVYEKTAIDLASDMMHTFPAFNGNKSNLEKHVLQSLAEEENFGSYINYINHPRNHIEHFIKESIEKFIFTEAPKEKHLSILKKNGLSICERVSNAVYDATEKVKSQGGNTDKWLEECSSLLKDVLIFDTKSSQNFSEINNFDFLKEEIEKGLKSIAEEMSSGSLLKLKELREKPDQILINHLCTTCWEQCPFCKAVCINTMADHTPGKHSVKYHRSSGVTGGWFKGTEEFSIEFCTTKVTSNLEFYPGSSEKSIPYKIYHTAGPEYKAWSITPDNSKLAYWKWVVCRFEKELENHYGKKFQGDGKIPSEWRTYKRDDAIKSLNDM
ncbi:interferon-induced very large GTPase 1-like [Diretmus argenteus]